MPSFALSALLLGAPLLTWLGCSEPCETGTRIIVDWPRDHPGPLPTGGTYTMDTSDGVVDIELSCDPDFGCDGEADRTGVATEFVLEIDGELVTVDLDQLEVDAPGRGCEDHVRYELP